MDIQMDKNQLSGILSDTWWMLLVRGVIAILFGVLTWIQPGISLAALVILFGIYSLTDGVLGIWTAISGRKEDDHWWAFLLWGLVGVGIGVLTLTAPGITTVALMFYIAIWAIASGVMQVVTAIRLRREIKGEWLLILAGAASILFGVIMVAQPLAGALTLLWLIATYAVVFGVIMVVLAFKAKKFKKQLVNS
ncbi:conserved membrane protein of unknown function [Pseudomonas marincola]|uniref:HdeD family acid-resistance protein n=2 Tax=Pseudomonas TaxID=286 RepID=A0A1I7AU74_9PSED|nr:conserved membrane protein of unknown function [Pseudomonas marincola]SFT78472.1 Uncharacterized membrane protein HdeD, DUF308 family [Pseudomonas marincola]|tara:strand:+ start:636 stop:1214 length:579 start_codon:yes stop_codon:yes gene_type:complete